MSGQSAFEYVMNRKVPVNENMNILYLVIQLFNGRVIRNENMVVTTENINTENVNAVFAMPLSDVLVSPDAHVDVSRLDENTNVVIKTFDNQPAQKPWYWLW